MSKPNVGFVGLGVMGFPMAGHLLAAGYSLSVHDIDSGVLQRVRNEMPAARVAATPGAVAGSPAILVYKLPKCP
jgi:3-hydroxyisobutyrate dehydrogenase-like beta-hydroxyacid dehydrogenase